MGSVSCSSIDGVGSIASTEEVKISVKERTQRFNKMASEVDLAHNKTNNGISTVGHQQERRESRSNKVII